MKLKNLFYFLLALPLVFAACDNGGDEIVPPALTLTSEATLSFEAEGGNGEISYKLENGVEGVTLTATANVEWIKDVVCGEKVTFVVEANELEEEREGKVTVAYAELSFDVTVKQAAAVVDVPSDKTEIVLESIDTVTLSSAGADAVIIYSLKNPVEGVEVTATPSVEWIKITEMNTEECKIRYHADATDTTEEREGKITVAYGEYGSFDVTVKQRGGSASFEVSCSDMKIEYTASKQSVAYKISFPEDATEEIKTTVNYIEPSETAPWITNITNTKDEVENGNENIITGVITFDVAEHTAKGNRIAEFVMSYAGNESKFKIEQKDNFPDDIKFDLLDIRATKQGNDWVLWLQEKHKNYGDPWTNITFKLDANYRYIPTGEYSIENGTIESGRITPESYYGSVYRSSTTGVASAIESCSISITINAETQTVSLNGSFQAQSLDTNDPSNNGLCNVLLEYEGEMEGFDMLYEAPLSDAITELNVTAYYNDNTKWTDFWLEGKNADGTLSYKIDLISTSDTLESGKYTFLEEVVPGNQAIQNCDIRSSHVTYGGGQGKFVTSYVDESGKTRDSAVTVIVGEDGVYTITLVAADNYDRVYKCQYKGTLTIR